MHQNESYSIILREYSKLQWQENKSKQTKRKSRIIDSMNYLGRCFSFLPRLAEQHASHDYTSARLIQRHWRGYRDRKYLQHLHSCAVLIQKHYRGRLGRKLAAARKRQQIQRIQRAYYDTMATKIQKVARGYISRKLKRHDNIQNFYARRAIIQATAVNGTRLLSILDSNYEQQLRAEEQARQDAESAQFTKLLRHTHHTVGTKTIPSVWQSKWGVEYDRTAYDMSIEEQIRQESHNRIIELQAIKEKARQKQAKKVKSIVNLRVAEVFVLCSLSDSFVVCLSVYLVSH